MIKLIEKILGIPEHGDSPRADLMLTNSILYIGVIVFIVGIALLISTLADFNSSMLLAALLVMLFGAVSIIWWRNSTITIIDNHSFKVSSMFGKVKTYRFDEITGYEKSYNYFTIFVGKEKFNIDETSLMTQRLKTRFNKALNKEVFKSN